LLIPNIYIWILAYISFKTDLWRWIYEVPILRNIYNRPIPKLIINLLIDEDYPGLSATKYVLFYILLIRLGTHWITSYPMGNWPNIRDDYHEELPIVKI